MGFFFGQLKLGLAMALVVWPGLHLSSQSRFARQELESINRRHESLSRVDRSVSVLVKLIVYRMMQKMQKRSLNDMKLSKLRQTLLNVPMILSFYVSKSDTLDPYSSAAASTCKLESRLAWCSRILPMSSSSGSTIIRFSSSGFSSSFVIMDIPIFRLGLMDMRVEMG